MATLQEELARITQQMQYEDFEPGTLTTHEKNPQPNAPSAPSASGFDFDCGPRGNSRVNALTSIEREPTVLTIGEQGIGTDGAGDSVKGNFVTENAIGMYLCEMEVALDVQGDGIIDQDYTQADLDNYREALKSQARLTLRFRDQKVRGLDYIRLGTMVWSSDCCGESAAHCVGAVLPEFGVLEAEITNLPNQPANVFAFIQVSIRANGCGCSCSNTKSGCGC